MKTTVKYKLDAIQEFDQQMTAGTIQNFCDVSTKQIGQFLSLNDRIEGKSEYQILHNKHPTSSRPSKNSAV